MNSEFFKKGKEMTQIYYNIFIFENFIRNFIENVAKKNYGSNFWDKLKIKKDIKKKIDDRKIAENENKWLSLRGDSNLFYIDFDDLRKIINSNWIIFEKYFPDEPWITTYLKDLYKLRNRLAHNSYLNSSEQNTVETLIINIYSQLNANLKYENLFEVKLEKLEYSEMDDEYLDEPEEEYDPSLYKIDFELVNNYLEMLDKGEIAYENIRDILNSIQNQISKIRRQEVLNQDDLINIINLCEILYKFMKNNDDNMKRRVLDVLENLTESSETKEILKNICYEYMVELFENGKHSSDLFRILDSFGYFKDLEDLLVKAIDQEDEGLLNDIYKGINFSKFKIKRIEIIRTLNHKLTSIHQDKRHLKDNVKKIIRKLEYL